MGVPRHRRQIGLFLLAVVMPSVLLLGLGAQLLRQERELAAKRLSDLERGLRRQLSDALQLQLDGLHRVADPSDPPADPAVILVAPMEDGRVRLPWEVAPRAASSAGAQEQLTPWSRELAAGQHQEMARRDVERAVGHFRRALSRASRPGEVAIARLHLARSLARLGRAEEAHDLRLLLFQESPAPVDEFGIPLWMYASEFLAASPGFAEQLLNRIESEVVSLRWPSPLIAFRARELLERLETSGQGQGDLPRLQDVRSDLDSRLRDLERMLALQRELPDLRRLHASSASAAASEPVWIASGEQLWLVGSSAGDDGRHLAVIVDGPAVWRQLLAVQDLERTPLGTPELISSHAGPGEPIGARFPGLAVDFSGPADPGYATFSETQRRLLLAAVAVVAGVTLFGAYLLWLHVRREVRTAELRSEFVASVSHELKTPLTAIRMFAETLAMGRPEESERRAQYLETIVHESERLSRLLDNVLDFAKIERGTKQYRRRPADLAAVVQAAARAVRYPLAQQGFRLEVETAGNLPPVPVDADALEQAILNLLGNAMKFSGNSRTLRLSLAGHDGRARIEVEDFGVGIPEQELSRIFDRFYRADSAEANRVPGAGLGLALVRHFAEAHGGSVEVASSLGEGSTFALELPLEDAP